MFTSSVFTSSEIFTDSSCSFTGSEISSLFAKLFSASLVSIDPFVTSAGFVNTPSKSLLMVELNETLSNLELRVELVLDLDTFEETEGL